MNKLESFKAVFNALDEIAKTLCLLCGGHKVDRDKVVSAYQHAEELRQHAYNKVKEFDV